MWKRSDLKARAKVSFKRNYWKSVLISLLLALVVGGSSGGAAGSAWSGDNKEAYNVTENQIYELDGDSDESEYDGSDSEALEQALNELNQEIDKELTGSQKAAFVTVFVLVFMITFIVIMAIMIVLSAFVGNPLEVGCKRFYLSNLNEPAQVGNIGYAFDNNYKNIVKTMFFRDLFTFLWSLLLVIPGIVKAYEYQMIPYLLADNPQMTREEAFAESKRMMQGQKWRAFVLDLSFLGWNILSAITIGIVGIFYVQPYMDATHAALYEALRYGTQDNSVY